MCVYNKFMEQGCSIDLLSFYYCFQQKIMYSIKLQDNSFIAFVDPFMIKTTRG